MPTLRQLRYLEALARHLNFGRAANECAVSQPALSQQIQEMERELGVDLVERSRSMVALTDAGRDAATRAARILAEVNELAAAARERGKPMGGTLRLGIIPTIGPYLLPLILPRLKQRFPDLDLQVQESRTANLVDALIERRIDLLLLALPVQRAGIATAALFEDPFYLLTPQGHRLSNRRAIDPAKLDGETLLLLEEGHCLRDQALNLCAKAGTAATDAFSATSLATIVQLVGNDYGVTILPGMAVPVEAGSRSAVAVAQFAKPQPFRTIGIAWRETSKRGGDYEEFGRIVREAWKARREKGEPH